MLFCPNCSNCLTIGDQEDSSDKCWYAARHCSRARLALHDPLRETPLMGPRICPTCPYKWKITKQVSPDSTLHRVWAVDATRSSRAGEGARGAR